MTENENNTGTSFFERPNVEMRNIPVAGGIPFGMESVTNSALGIGGAYGAWGPSYNNQQLPAFVSMRLGQTLPESEVMNLSELGFVSRHHIETLTGAEHLEVELEVGASLLKQAAKANGWEPSEVEGVLIGMSGPVSLDYVEQISKRAGIPAAPKSCAPSSKRCRALASSSSARRRALACGCASRGRGP